MATINHGDDLFLFAHCHKDVLTKDILAACYPFTCGTDPDMDEFFREDAIDYTRFKMGKTYCFILDEDPRRIVACVTVSNDSLRIYDLPNSRKNAMWKLTKREKMINRFPGVLIGRLAVAKEFANMGIGTQILRFLKAWFDEDSNKTACRFLIVDAKNEPGVLSFYQKNGFEFLFTSELQEDLYTKPAKGHDEETKRKLNPRKLKTRLMYFDLINL